MVIHNLYLIIVKSIDHDHSIPMVAMFFLQVTPPDLTDFFPTLQALATRQSPTGFDRADTWSVLNLRGNSCNVGPPQITTSL